MSDTTDTARDAIEPCPNCGDKTPDKIRLTCPTCKTTTCIWCAWDFHEIGVHPTDKTMRWRDWPRPVPVHPDQGVLFDMLEDSPVTPGGVTVSFSDRDAAVDVPTGAFL